MNCRSQVTLETFILLATFIAFIGLLVHIEVRFVKELHRRNLEIGFDDPAKAFGKSRSLEANFTRWFR